MSLDKATVIRMAHLARIKVPESELDPLAGDLNRILTFVEQLREVDTEGVPPVASVVTDPLPRRDDVVSDGGYAEEILANAPERTEGFFVVPKVVE